MQHKTFHAHRAILAARSPCLARKLKSDPHLSTVNINDIKWQTFEALLRFLYTGTLGALAANMDDSQGLQQVAKLFEMRTLSEICTEASHGRDIDDCITRIIESLV